MYEYFPQPDPHPRELEAITWDEREHFFKNEGYHSYRHYSRSRIKIDQKWGTTERLEEPRFFTVEEAQAWIVEHNPPPITEGEVEAVKKGSLAQLGINKEEEAE